MTNKAKRNEDTVEPLVGRLSQQIVEAMEIASALSKDMRDGESAVAWVKRVLDEREYARTTVALIDRECSLCAPIATLADRVQWLIHQREANAAADLRRKENDEIKSNQG